MGSYVALHNMPLHELLQRGKRQGLWPISEALAGMSTDDIVTHEAQRTGHAAKYIRQVYKAGSTLAPHEWPSLYKEGDRVQLDLTSIGRAKFNNKPNPKKRMAIADGHEARRAGIRHNAKVRVVNDAAPMRTNAGQLERVKDHAPVITNGRMRKNSKATTSYSTGFAPPSRKDETRVEFKKKVIKRFRRD